MEPNPSAPVNNTSSPENPDGAKFFLASKTFWIALLGAVVAPLLKRCGIELSDAHQQAVAEGIVQVGTVIGILWARSRATGPLHFGTGIGPVIVALILLIALSGCTSTTFSSANFSLRRVSVLQQVQAQTVTIGADGSASLAGYGNDGGAAASAAVVGSAVSAAIHAAK